MSSNNSTDNGSPPAVCPPTPPASIVMLTMEVVFVLTLCKICHLLFSRIRQPRIIAELFVGMVIGNLKVADLIASSLMEAFPLLEGVSASLYMFVLGLEMEPLAILRPPGPEAKIACAGIFSTWATYILTYFVLQSIPFLAALNTTFLSDGRTLASFAVVFSATSSPILTRLVTELKLGQSEIGRRAIRAGLANDLLCSLLMCFLIAFRNKNRFQFLYIFGWVALETIIAKYLVPHLLEWVNKRNPEGKPMKGMDMTIVLLATQVLCYSAPLVLYDIKVNSFLIGLALPRRGRVSNFLIGKINCALSTTILPLYLTMAGLNLNLRMWNVDVNANGAPTAGAGPITVIRIIVISILAIAGKLLGTLIVCLQHGLHWLEAVTLGVLLNIKGYLLIIFSIHAKSHNKMNENSLLVMMFAVILSIVYVPSTVFYIIQRVRMVKGEGVARVTSMQSYNTVSELRLTVGLYGPQNVASMMVLVETMRSGSNAGAGIVVYALDLVEMTDEAALVYRQGTEEVMIADDVVVELREQIRDALDDYIQKNKCQDIDDISIGSSNSSTTTMTSVPNKITVRHNLAVSSFSTMHGDVYCCAQDSLSLLILLPFHKSYISEGSDIDNNGHSGVRTVNDNLLQNAPCSVGILVDRGLGKNRVRFTPPSDPDVAATISQLNIVVVFIGGADDREALACAGVMANHPSIYLMAMRIILDTEAIQMDAPGRRLLTAIPPNEVEIETKIDDEYFAGFYNHFISKGRVGYMEKHVKNGIQAVAALREMAEGGNNYQLFIVGQGKDRKSLLTAGLSEWTECPELGPIGDILAASDFETDASVLVIQQHHPERNTKGNRDDLDLFDIS